MEIIGRLTDGATVSKTRNGKEVVNFCIAVNERYKSKDGSTVKTTIYINCSYWVNTKVAEHLHKGTIVSLFGSLSTKAYIDNNGEAQPVLYYHVNNIKIIAQSHKQAA